MTKLLSPISANASAKDYVKAIMQAAAEDIEKTRQEQIAEAAQANKHIQIGDDVTICALRLPTYVTPYSKLGLIQSFLQNPIKTNPVLTRIKEQVTLSNLLAAFERLAADPAIDQEKLKQAQAGIMQALYEHQESKRKWKTGITLALSLLFPPALLVTIPLAVYWWTAGKLKEPVQKLQISNEEYKALKDIGNVKEIKSKYKELLKKRDENNQNPSDKIDNKLDSNSNNDVLKALASMHNSSGEFKKVRSENSLFMAKEQAYRINLLKSAVKQDCSITDKIAKDYAASKERSRAPK